MTETIWLSDLYRTSELGRPFGDNKPGEPGERDQIEVQLDARAARSWKVKSGERFAQEDLPTTFYKHMSEDEYAGSKQFHSLPPAMRTNYVFVDEEIAAVMRDFELGEHALHPVDLYLNDCVTKVNKQYYLLNFGVRKSTIDRESSETVRQRWPDIEEYSIATGITVPGSKAKPKLYYHTEALRGPDLWVDPEFSGLIFLSNRLGMALKNAGFEQAMRLYPVLAPES